MVRNSLSERRQIGLDFFGFLKETDRASIVNRLELREIYNQKFKTRDAELKYPNFGSVLYALKVSGKITRRKDNIYFSSAVRELYVDQWQRPRRRQPQPVQNGAAGPGPVQNGAAGPGPVQVTSAEGAETGVRDRRKLASLLISELKTHRALFISDKHGVSITAEEPFEDGRLQLWVEDTHVDEYVVKLTVNNTRTTAVHFTYYTSLQWLGYLTLRDESKVTKKNPLSLQPGDSYEIQVCFSCKMVGFYPATLAFEFKPDLNDSDAFHIVRFFEARCVTALGRELAPVAPYRPLSLPAWTPEVKCMIVDGQPPEGLSVLRLRNVVPLRDYKIPLYMNELIKLLKQPAGVSGRRMALLESPLSWENYCEKFHLLLFLEELQMEVDIKRYNIPNNDKEYATMVRDPANKKLLILEVPGVSENRPSVLRGDKLLVCPLGETGVKYCGYVHSVQLDCVKLGFDSKLLDLFVDNMKFKVEFTVNRLTLRLQHRAVDLAIEKRLENVLFPAAPSYFPPPTELPKLRLFDSKLERNPEQLHAVQRIVAGSSKPAPYLVFGPPGTGKTVTLVEAIKQIEKTQASCHILACAPSNSAADLLCTKILEHVDQHKVHRMYASSRDPQLVPKNLKECSNLEGDCYVFAPKEKLMEYRIMVTTLITAGRLVTGGILEGHYTHVFVDEAGHAVETECLIPLAGLLHAESGQVVLAGDPKQLGPILRSPFALKYGMGVSFLERMMNDIPLYQKDQEDGFDSRFVTKLLRNYRSHPAILKVPNELFYDNKLQACADEIKRNSYCRWEHLKKKDFPLILHNVTGIDEREASSPSFFNVAEVEVLMNYVRKLLETGGKKGLATILPKDIGIIAPYRKQVQKIRKFLEKVGKDLKLKDINDLKVGSVEEFQGQERRVILVSTVRSNTKYAEFDRKFSLGFVKNEKRFNVAVTRAQALLIVVGNTRVLKTDTTWNRFIQYCREEGCYIDFGADDDDDEENMIERFASLYLDIKPEVETAESAIQQSLHPEWRNDL